MEEITKDELATILDRYTDPNGNKCFKECKKKSGRAQYKGINWYYLALTDEFRGYLVSKGIESKIGFIPIGINLMPYRISGKDINKSVVSKNHPGVNFISENKRDDKEKFCDAIQKDPSYVDFDSNTGNFHIKANGLYQAVWVQGKKVTINVNVGPGYNKDKDDIWQAIHTQAYYPAIEKDEDKTDYNIPCIMNNMLKDYINIIQEN